MRVARTMVLQISSCDRKTMKSFEILIEPRKVEKNCIIKNASVFLFDIFKYIKELLYKSNNLWYCYSVRNIIQISIIYSYPFYKKIMNNVYKNSIIFFFDPSSDALKSKNYFWSWCHSKRDFCIISIQLYIFLTVSIPNADWTRAAYVD